MRIFKKKLLIKMKFGRVIFLISILFLFETSGVIDGESFKPNPRAVTSLRKPPEAEAILHFEGNQAVYLYCKNCNVLPLLVAIDCSTIICPTELFAMPPLGMSKIKRYSVFGETPISWNFVIKTIVDVACVWIYAEWGREWSKEWDKLL